MAWALVILLRSRASGVNSKKSVADNVHIHTVSEDSGPLPADRICLERENKENLQSCGSYRVP
jgi:hypothetical protein